MSLLTGRLGLQQRKHAMPSSSLQPTMVKEETYSETKTKQQHKQSHHDGHVLIPLQQRSLIGRYDVGPFIVIYALLVVLDHMELDDNLHLLKTIAFPLALISHLAVVVAQQWRVRVRSRVGYSISKHPKKWTHCWVRAPSVGGVVDAEICPIRFQDQVAIVNFRDVVFRAALDGTVDMMDTLFLSTKSAAKDKRNSSMLQFCRLQYPDDLPLEFYKQWKGHVTLDSSTRALDVYGTNTTQIQLPPFLHLLGQQLLAPFFLFQLLCVVLWSLDEYWYYAIFTLFALIMFECTVAYNRLKNLERLRGTLRHAYHVYVFRHSHWIGLKTHELLPGDVVSLSSFQPISRRSQQQQHQERHVPADVLLLQGDVVVDEALLTGESIPQLKGPLDMAVSGSELSNLDTKDSQHKQSVLFGGTVLVSHDNKEESTLFPRPPDGGVVGLVLRTGFETAQGSLLRTMAHSSSQTIDGIYTRDTFVFVSLLLLCAVASAISVLLEGWHDDTRNRFRLLLHVIIIITSVVPPELPMELSLAVTNSVADLMKRCNVYCTEPYRIPWAGRVDVCCFDKTGTLTSDEMRLRGVRLPNADELVLPSMEGEETVPWPTMRVMVACHALAMGVGKDKDGVMGDPLEKAVLQNTPYRLLRNGVLTPSAAPGSSYSMPQKVTIHHRFAFSSRLKRMTVLVTEGKDEDIWALSKGAPETIKTFLKQESIPSNYDKVYTHHMSLGQRVLAMGYRNLGKKKSVLALKEEGRDVVEKDLIFAGFLVLDCPLKPDSKHVIAELRKSGHDVVMITGDAVLTAAEVARQVSIISVDKTQADHVTYELRDRSFSNKDDESSEPVLSRFAFFPLSGNSNGTDASSDKSILLSKANLKLLTEMSSRSEASFCVSGKVLANFAVGAVRHGKHDFGSIDPSLMDEKNVLFHPAAQAFLKDLVPIINVFARHAPRQKEAVVAAFNLGGRHTLMCGDGTNDVGALKRAHVGISIISAPEVEDKQRKANAAVSKVKAEQKREKRKAAQAKQGKSRKSAGSSAPNKKARSAILEDSLRQLREAQEELDYVELGDASVASPFTSRAVSIKCCKDVLLQGRCTLVTMLQIYKILGVNSLVSALVLSKLHMHGVKQGDRQLTILGIVVALLFLFVTRGKPLPTLSPHRPPSSVLCKQALLSIAVQFLVHSASILAVTHISLSYVDPWDPSIIPDGSFNPNVLNSCTFLLTVLATINTFVVNYRGRPFMEDLRENIIMVRSALFCYAILFACTLEVFPPLNDLLQLTPLPDATMFFTEEDGSAPTDALGASGMHSFVGAVGFPVAMCFLMVVDTVLAYVAEKSIVHYFEG